MKKFLVLLILILTASCTDADMAALGAWGDPAHVICYSGGVIIYDGFSSGKIAETESDGYYFMDKHTKKLVSVSGDCTIFHNKTAPE